MPSPRSLLVTLVGRGGRCGQLEHEHCRALRRFVQRQHGDRSLAACTGRRFDRFDRFVRSALLLSVAACGHTDAVAPRDPNASDGNHKLTRIQLSPSPLTVWLGERDTLRVQAFDAAGNAVPAPAVRWGSDDPAIASIDALGVLIGIAEGRTTVTATSGGASASVAVEVLGIASVELNGPPTLLVNESAVLDVTARAPGGQVIKNPHWATFSSSDSSLLEVSGSGTVRGLRRGTAFISVHVAKATTAMALDVGARLELRPSYALMRMQVIDTLRLTAVYADVYGVEIADRPVVRWGSNNPDVVRVTSGGLVTATASAMARISAATSGDSAFTDVSVDDFRPGQTTTVRYVHALRGADPITFVPSVGDAVTLSFGQSVERPIAPGTYLVHAEIPGYGQTVTLAVVRDGDQVAVYALDAMGATPSQGYLQVVWSRHQSLPPEWGKLRVMQGSNFATYFLRPKGAALAGLPEECYFDGGNVHEPLGAIASGNYDIIATTKYGWGNGGGPVEIARMPVAVLPGRAITAVLLGTSAADAGVLTFIDP